MRLKQESYGRILLVSVKTDLNSVFPLFEMWNHSVIIDAQLTFDCQITIGKKLGLNRLIKSVCLNCIYNIEGQEKREPE